MNLDFFLAKQKHHLWKIQLKAFLLGLQEFSTDKAVNHTQCELGQWLYGFGMNRYGSIKEMVELERIHQEMHKAVHAIIEAKHQGQIAKANDLYKGLIEISNEIEKLLDAVEKQIIYENEKVERS